MTLLRADIKLILARYIFTAIGIHLKFSEHVIKADEFFLKGLTTPVVDLGPYEFKYLNKVKLHLQDFL